MDELELIEESIFKIEEVKKEPTDSGDENMREDMQTSIAVEELVDDSGVRTVDCWSSVTVKPVPSTSEAAGEQQENLEEDELKPVSAVFLPTSVEVEAYVEQAQVKSEPGICGATGEHQEDLEEEELKPVSAVFLPASVEIEANVEQAQVKSEPSTCEAAGEHQEDLEEEELKPVSAVFLLPKVEIEANVEQEQDPLALSDNIHLSAKIKEEKAENDLSSPGSRDEFQEAEDEGHVQCLLGGGAAGGWACAVSMASEHLASFGSSASAEVKTFQCAICTSNFSETDGVSTHVTQSEKNRRFCSSCTEIFVARGNAVIDIPSFNKYNNEYVPAEGVEHVPPDPNVLKGRHISKPETNLLCYPVFRIVHFPTGERLYECGKCKMSFKSKSEVVSHNRSHTGEKTYECGECEKHFVSEGALNIHSRIHTGERPYKCKECEKQFMSQGALNKHSRIHTGERPFECGECKKRFRTKSFLVIHNRTHTGERPYECGECKMHFKSKFDVFRHIRVHSADRPYECGECRMLFKERSSLVVHIRTHTGERPYECGKCKKRFKTQSQIASHNRTHTGEKPFECGVCQKRYVSKQSLVAHIRTNSC